MHLLKPSFLLAPVIANFLSLITPRRPFLVRFLLPPPCQPLSASFIQRGTCRVPRTSMSIGTLEPLRSTPTSSHTGSPVSTLTQQEITPKRIRWSLSCVRMVRAPEPHVSIYQRLHSFFCLLAGHTHIDILKIDLEGWEFDALTTFLLPNSDFTSQKPRAPPVSQMLLELHLWGRDFSDLLSWWTVLERAGLRAVAREPNLVYQNYNRMQGAELAEVCCFPSSSK